MDTNFFSKHNLEIKTTEEYLLTVIKAVLEANNREEKMVEHISSRIKSTESIKKKLLAKGVEPTEENALENLSDVIGIRLIVHFIGDIYKIRDILVNSNKFKIIREKDYVKHPKPTGYRSYHIVIEVSMNDITLQAEIQLRTVAMDCWASLEHEIRYKKNIQGLAIIHNELKKCSDDLMSADITMEQIRRAVDAYSPETTENDEEL